MSDTKKQSFFDTTVLGHPAGLFVLFFTEMWERFSFYGMRVLLINFLTMSLIGFNPGWEWSVENAAALFGTYAMSLYLTPILGGVIADRLTGYRWAVVIGSVIMTLGHVSMAFETEFSLYLGLGLLVLGTGFFKPNISSIISEMYKELPEKKDGAYTIFYMGVNAGAFFGMMLCGYVAEKVGWAYGFGLAGIFMLLGTLQFWLAKPLFGTIGDVPSKVKKEVNTTVKETAKKQSETVLETEEKPNPYTLVDKILIAVTSVIGVAYAFNDPLDKIGNFNLFPFEVAGLSGQYAVAIFGLILFLYLVISRILRYSTVVRDQMFAVIIFAFFTVFFWMSFEQGASSLVIFARDNVNRVLTGNYAVLFNVLNTLLTVVPLCIITYVLYLLGKRTFKIIPGSNIVLIICFTGVWAVAGWMLKRDHDTTSYDVVYKAVKTVKTDKKGNSLKDEEGNVMYAYKAITESTKLADTDVVVDKTTSIGEPVKLEVGANILMIPKDKFGENFGYLDANRLKHAKERAEELHKDNGIVKATVASINDSEIEITVSWFSILNSFFIIAFASMFSKWWESKYNPSAASKYALGLIIMAIGFGLLAYGAYGVKAGVKVSMVWLILAYLFHTLGELCLSPVGLSYVSKLVPARMIALMFGMWYLAIAIGNKLAAVLGGSIEKITEAYDLSTFFLIFTIVPFVAGLLVLSLNPVLKKLMHGVK
ncbi:peptide MFS transporter [Tenacibaculum finnmarkense genomovar finnmarkense]|uniref:peptide MFS transporter n=1 Tax=Tenacibaculum finnmarkense TaxID=2781243 RepID=UPI001BEA0C81|nr:peptide MFS transporter [Tenacibaculum finnmarkense]MCD8406698.1 peptide MFS transporter [Tenacibaculum dicentrarchi]MCD8414320.1 peptide MFS transporter [Tenacibaculum dicentrarchi]MCD8419042.1 peptide MFS transporter [Tenacibaculum dicentrarchi]MCD8434258.1 peptide MFS transporter [Tenacibaculum dicentrarchi]MCD8436624.1 peptide MFS transporter [Tenacibaculum dicentrarchi]